jgi:hypothetical protein
MIKNLHLQEESILALHHNSAEKAARDDGLRARVAELEAENRELKKRNLELMKEVGALKAVSSKKQKPQLDLPQQVRIVK